MREGYHEEAQMAFGSDWTTHTKLNTTSYKSTQKQTESVLTALAEQHTVCIRRVRVSFKSSLGEPTWKTDNYGLAFAKR